MDQVGFVKRTQVLAAIHVMTPAPRAAGKEQRMSGRGLILHVLHRSKEGNNQTITLRDKWDAAMLERQSRRFAFGRT